MPDLVTYSRADLVSTIAMDDGRVNMFSIPMLRRCTRPSTRPSGTRRSSC